MRCIIIIIIIIITGFLKASPNVWLSWTTKNILSQLYNIHVLKHTLPYKYAYYFGAWSCYVA